MIETTVVKWLADELGVPVYAEMPEKPPPEFIIVEKTGSAGDRYVPQAVAAVQSYAPSLAEAAKLNSRAKAAMLGDDFLSLDEIVGCGCSSDCFFPDARIKKYRYQAIFTIRYYE